MFTHAKPATATTRALSRLARDRRVGIAFLAGLFGLLVSYLEVQVLPGVIMIFSGVLYLLIAIAYGPLLGALAAAIALGRTFWLLGNGYSVAFAILETSVIGYLTRSRRIAAPMAALLFWLVLGLPVASFTIFVVLHLPTSGWANVLKRALNGFINVIAADLLLALPLVSDFLFKDRPQRRSLPLRDLISSSLLLVSMLPIVIISIVHVRSSTRVEESAVKSQMQAVVSTMNMEVDDHVRRHRDAVLSLSRAIVSQGSFSPANLQRLIRENHTINTGFLTMLIADKDGRVIASSPDLEGSHSIADRDYFLQAIHEESPYISKVFAGRGFGHDPIVAISAAIRAPGGSLLGIVEGSLDLNQFQRFEAVHRHLPQTDVLISDQNNRVIYASSRLPYRALEQAPAIAAPIEGLSERSLLDRSPTVREPGYLTRSAASTLTGWHITARQSLLPLQELTEAYYLRTLAWLLAAGTLAYLLAKVIARRITSPLEGLMQSLRDFRVGELWQPPLAPSYSTPHELLGIQDYLGALATRLAESYRSMRRALEEKEVLNSELKALAAQLDRKVQERTAELEQATARAQDANNAKSLFLASMSHEIRTPLNAVIGMTDLLATSDLPAEELNLAETIRTSAHGLLVLINDILDFTKIESGKLELEVVEFDLREVVEGVIAMVAPDAQARGIELAYRIPADVPKLLTGDPNRVQQIIMNLASNAVKFTAEGEVLIAVELKESVGGIAHIRVLVVDTGIGITPNTQDHLFQPFTQADVSTTRQFGGTGLGLAVSRRLVELMHGTIGVESQVGVGSTFWFELSLCVPVGVAAQVPPVFDHPVLIVDDNATARLAMQENLTALGVHTTSVDNGRAALEALLQQPYSAVILDYDLAPIDGISCEDAIRLRPEFEQIPIILLRPHTERIRTADGRWTASLKKPASARRVLDCLFALAHRPEAFHAEMAASANGAPPFVPTGKHRRIILLVEDNPINQRVALRMLDPDGLPDDRDGRL